MKIFTIWNRVEVGADRYTPGVYRSGDLVLPAIQRAPGLSVELSGLLPNRDHNDDLLSAISRMPRCLSGEHPVFGVLAADPFLRVDQMADRLAQKGYTDITNLPSVTQYGASYAAVLNDLDVGVKRELQVLSRFKARGLALSIAVSAVKELSSALALHPRHLFVVPSFDLWREQLPGPDALINLCLAAAAQRDHLSPATSIVLVAGRLPISRTQADDAGADGILLD